MLQQKTMVLARGEEEEAGRGGEGEEGEHEGKEEEGL